MRILACLIMMIVAATPALAAFVPGEVLVRLDRAEVLAVQNGRPEAASQDLATVLARHGLSHAELVSHKIDARTDRDSEFILLRSDRADFDAQAAAAALQRIQGIRAASVNGLRELFFTPNDTYFNRQWFLQPGNAAGIKVGEAWDLVTGDGSVLIAIMDTGIDWSHPDIGANVRVNPGETAANGLDDDDNGYIDDLRGWDFGNHDADARPHTTLEQGLDVGFHGTHCAGIASAVTNNGAGVAGAGYHCNLIPLKIVNTASEFTDAAITEAFLYAIDNGVDVISMSFGGPDEGGAAAFYQTLIDDANAAGIVCVAAAGNNNDASLMYPAACSGVISVGATNASGQRASFSSYGAWVTVNAPGEHIWSTIQDNYDFDFLTSFLYQFAYEYDGVNPYMYCDGTSMACPLVAGVCGLIRSVAPSLSPVAVRQLLIDTGDHVTYDQPIGVKVDALAAVESVQSTAVAGSPLSVLRVSCAPNPFNPSTTLTFALAASGPAQIDVFDAVGRHVRTLLVDRSLAADTHAVAWDGKDDAGEDVASGVYLVRLRAGGESRYSKVALVR